MVECILGNRIHAAACVWSLSTRTPTLLNWGTHHCCVTPSSFTINIKAARDFCPDVICRHLNVYCNCGLLSIALGSEDTYVDFPSERYSLTSHAGHSLPTFKMTKSATHTTSNIVFDRHKYVFNQLQLDLCV